MTVKTRIAAALQSTKDIVWSGATSAINCVLFWTGSITGTSTGEVNFNILQVNSNHLAAANSSDLVSALKVNHIFGGSTCKGAIQGSYSVVNMTGTTLNLADSGYYIADAAVAQASANDNGDGSNPSGHLYGGNDNVRLISGATYWDQIVGREINVAVGTGASVADKIGLQIVKTTSDVINGSRRNSALVIADQMDAASSTVGWAIGLAFGTYSGYNAIAPTGSLIAGDLHAGGSSAGTVTYGIDFSLFTFTGAGLVLPLKTPASAAATGKLGSICWDTSYVYVCTAADTWKRVAIATW